MVSMQRGDDGMGTFSANLTADGITTVRNALDARAWASRALAGQTQGDERTLGQRRADALVEVCAQALDRSLGGNIEYHQPPDSYRRRASADAPDVPTHAARPAGSAPAHKAASTTEPATAHATDADEQPQPPEPAVVVPRELTEAALKRLRSVLQRRCMINVHMGADVVLGVSDNPVYLEGLWVDGRAGRAAGSQPERGDEAHRRRPGDRAGVEHLRDDLHPERGDGRRGADARPAVHVPDMRAQVGGLPARPHGPASEGSRRGIETR